MYLCVVGEASSGFKIFDRGFCILVHVKCFFLLFVFTGSSFVVSFFSGSYFLGGLVGNCGVFWVILVGGA